MLISIAMQCKKFMCSTYKKRILVDSRQYCERFVYIWNNDKTVAMETTIYLITMCSGCQRCSFICCLLLAILIISVMKRKIVASGSYTLMIVSYIPRQPLREYKTNNGQKERKMFLFLVMIHLSIMITSFCVWAEFLVLGYVYSGYGTGWNLHCVLVLLYKEPLHPLYGSVSSFGCIVMFIWNLDIFRPFSWFL